MKRVLGLILVLVCVDSVQADDPPLVAIRPVPVRSNGVHQVIGNEIVLLGGGQVVLIDFVVDDWDPLEKGTRIKAFQVWLDEASLRNDLSGTLTPYFANCTSTAQCVSAVGSGSTCNLGSEPYALNKCAAGFIDISRTNYLFKGQSNLAGVDQSTVEVRWAAAILSEPIWITRCSGGLFPGNACYTNDDCPPFPPTIPPGTCQISHAPRYLGTLALFVPLDAVGTFTIRLRGGTLTNLIDGGSQILPGTTGEALITIACKGINNCQSSNPCLTASCVNERCVAEPTYDDTQFCCTPSDGILCPKAISAGDSDNDGDHDLADFATLQGCFGGTPEGAGDPCAAADLVCDCLIDAGDHRQFSKILTGPTAP